MKNTLLVFPLLACSLIFAAKEKVSKETIEFEGKKRTYYLYAPENAKNSAPLLILLHGAGRNGLSLMDKWKGLGESEGIVLIAPDAFNSQGWAAPVDGPDFIHELVEKVETSYSIDPRRVYLFGHSAGAVFALLMSFMQSEYLAATAIHAGAFRDPAEYQVVNMAARKIPIAIWIGTEDPLFPLKSVRETKDVLEKYGFPIVVNEMPRHNHWYYDLAPKINKSAWDFLKNHRLEDPPKYQKVRFH